MYLSPHPGLVAISNGMEGDNASVGSLRYWNGIDAREVMTISARIPGKIPKNEKECDQCMAKIRA